MPLTVKVIPEAERLLEEALSFFARGERPSPQALANAAIMRALLDWRKRVHDARDFQRGVGARAGDRSHD